MSTEKHDPWALLREARETLDGIGYSEHPVGMSNAESRAVECIKRINAALAAHDAREADFRRERDDAVLAAIVARGG